MRSLAAVSALGSLLLTTLVGTPPSGAAAATCLGRPATMVVSGGGTHQGTDGDDVIVSHGASVDALGGDDLICLTGHAVDVHAGDGDDRVEAGSATDTVVWLDDGRDRFSGSPGLDLVYSTGGGADAVITRRGRDTVIVGDPVAGSSYRLGAGFDTLDLGRLDTSLSPVTVHRLRVDLAAGTYDIGDDGADGVILGAEALYARSAWLRVTGSPGNDVLNGFGCDVSLRGRAGNDGLRRRSTGIDAACAGVPWVTQVVGGPGDDRMRGSSRLDDVLVGGRGYDIADGDDGTDTCRAEVRRNCEG